MPTKLLITPMRIGVEGLGVANSNDEMVGLDLAVITSFQCKRKKMDSRCLRINRYYDTVEEPDEFGKPVSFGRWAREGSAPDVESNENYGDGRCKLWSHIFELA